MIWMQAAAAAYLVGMALVIDASSNMLSRVIFKVAPMCIGLPLAFGVAARLHGERKGGGYCPCRRRRTRAVRQDCGGP